MNDWFLDDSFNLFYSFFDNNLWYDSFNNLWYLNNFLYYSWNNNNLFNNLFNFYNFRYLYQFFNNLFNWYFNFFNSINMSNNLNNFLFNIFYGFWYLNVVVDDFFNFNDLGFTNDERITKIYLFDDGLLWSLNDGFLDDLDDFDDLLYKNWNLDYLFDLFHDLSGLDNRPVSDNLDLFNTILNDDLFSYYWYFIRLFNNSISLNDSFNNLWYFYDFLYSLNNWDWFFNNSIDNLISDLDEVLDLFSDSVFNLRNDLFNNLFYFDNLWNLNDLLDDLLNYNWNLDYFFDDLLLNW